MASSIDYIDTAIPKTIYCEDDSCSSIGSLAEDDGERLHMPHRWNCDLRTAIEDSNCVYPTPEASELRRRLESCPDPDVFPPMVMGASVSQQNYDEEGLGKDGSSKGKLGCTPNVFGGRKMSAHSRMEMWHHQVSKPFRVLGSRKKNLKSMVNNSNAAALNCSKSRRRLRETREEDDFEAFLQDRHQTTINHLPSDIFHKSEEEKQETEFPPFLECQHPGASQKGNIFRPYDDLQWMSQAPTDESSEDESVVILAIDLG
eukprot:scaffold1900_cov123-Cylindrotheca_fusiformis.AAC.31